MLYVLTGEDDVFAVDVESGAIRWKYDSGIGSIAGTSSRCATTSGTDSPSPVVLFDAEFDGEKRHAIAQTSKTGWTYVLDRETGEPLLPIEDEPVAQDPVQKTAATQPIPSGCTRSGDVPPAGKRGQVADLGSVFTTTGFGTRARSTSRSLQVGTRSPRARTATRQPVALLARRDDGPCKARRSR
jgi:glucose dehydrogenase